MINGIERQEYERWLAHTYLHVFSIEDLTKELGRKVCQQTEKLTSKEVEQLKEFQQHLKTFLND